MNDKFLNLLGMCRKAGKCATGFEASIAALHARKAAAVFWADDISPKTVKELRFHAGGQNILYPIAYTKAQIGASVGINAGIIAILDTGFAGKALSLKEELSI